MNTLKQCNEMVNFWTGKEASEQKTVVLKYWLKQKELLKPKRKIETIVKDIKKAEDKLEVLQGYCDSYKQGHMEYTNSRLNVWEPTAKNNNMQKTVYSKLSKLDDELKEVIKGLNVSSEKAIELLVEKGVYSEIAYDMITEWEV